MLFSTCVMVLLPPRFHLFMDALLISFSVSEVASSVQLD